MLHPRCGAAQGQSAFTLPFYISQTSPCLWKQHTTQIWIWFGFARLSAESIRICLHLYVKSAQRCVPISTSYTTSCRREVVIFQVLLTNFFQQQQIHRCFSLTTAATSARWQLPILYKIRKHGKQCANSALTILTGALLCFILPFDSYSAFPSSLFSSPSLDNRERDEGGEGEKGVINRPDAMWLHQIQPSSRQELICLNLSHCSTATIWKPGQRRIGLLHCNLCCLRSSWLVTLSRYLRREAVFTGAGGQRGHWRVKWRTGVAQIQVFGILVSCYISLLEK